MIHDSSAVPQGKNATLERSCTELQEVVSKQRGNISTIDAELGGTKVRLPEREFFIDNLLVRIHLIILMIRWTGLAPWEFGFTFPGSLTSTFPVRLPSDTPNPEPLTLNHEP